MGLSKIYLETYARARRRRSRPAPVAAAGDAARGGGGLRGSRHPHGGMRLHHRHRRAGRLPDRFQLRHARDAQAVAEARGGGEFFDELIIDDFFFTADASAVSNAPGVAHEHGLYPTNYTANGTAVRPIL